ncbi:MAG: aldo/keto reductase [Planctomycetes bacterium]|nr:aldo/keto reductase [Planctomycetota bacterium]
MEQDREIDNHAPLGQGTWRMGEDAGQRAAEVAALRLGLDLGLTVIDTAEMYADGGAERVVGEAIAGRRDEVYLVSKVLPVNASCQGTRRACEQSLARLSTDRLDLYLLHWESEHPFAETLRAFEQLAQDGKILDWGVSNFDRAELEAAAALPGGDGMVANQVFYNLERRSAERKVLPWCREHGVVLMAYSPLAQGRLERRPALVRVAERHGVSPEAIALAWVLRLPDAVALVKATNPDHVRTNAVALDLELTAEDLAALERDYPAPRGDVELESL